MSEFRYWSLSSWSDARNFALFWTAFGLLAGPLIGFLLGSRNTDDFIRSTRIGLVFSFTMGVLIALSWRFVRPRLTGGAVSIEGGRALLADAALRFVVTIVGTLLAVVLADRLVAPGFLRDPHAMASILIYMLAGSTIFATVSYAQQYQKGYRARVRSEEQYKARVEHEMRTAAAIQSALLPAPRPADGPLRIACRTLPHHTIAGDFFDHFETPDGSLAFVIGDVAGKGPPAAILAAAIQGMVAAFASAGGTPGSVVERLNEALLRRTAESRFATLALGVIDRVGRVVLANAGHPRAVLVRHDGSTARLERGGALLGVLPDVGMVEETVQLGAGDSLVLFSDGLSEARDAAGEEFGDARVLAGAVAARSLPPERALEALIESQRRFSAGVPTEDDVTIVVLRYQPSG